MTVIVLLAVFLLAYANGANDNFKGVATLYGSGTASYRASLAWATVTTLGGSLLALALAAGLVKTFSGKGLVPDGVATSPAFVAATASGAMATVLLASRLGLPVSTTHALSGALVGAGLVAAGAAVNFAALGRSFFLPLVVTPVLAMTLAALLYPLARQARRILGVERDSCVCVGAAPLVRLARGPGAMALAATLDASVGREHACQERYRGAVLGLSAQHALDGLHFLSAGAVGFARGLNDTPKIVALLLVAGAVGAHTSLGLVGLAMALGGLFGARRVAETLAHKVTPLDPGQGFVANVTTAALVLGASHLGMPVSTTHVATGGLFGIGMVKGTARWRMVATIGAAWVTTLPLAALLGALSCLVLYRVAS